MQQLVGPVAQEDDIVAKLHMDMDYQISQARKVKHLTAENNRMRAEIVWLRSALEQIASSDIDCAHAIANRALYPPNDQANGR